MQKTSDEPPSLHSVQAFPRQNLKSAWGSLSPGLPIPGLTLQPCSGVTGIPQPSHVLAILLEPVQQEGLWKHRTLALGLGSSDRMEES